MHIASPHERVSRSHQSVLGWVRMVIDPAVITTCFALSCALHRREIGGAEIVVMLMIFSVSFPGEVSIRRLNKGLARGIVLRWVATGGLLLFLGYATRFIGYFDRWLLLTWLVMTPTLLYASHRLIPWIAPQLLAFEGVRRAVVLAPNETGRRLARTLRDEPMLGYHFLGYFGALSGAAAGESLDGPMLGDIRDVAPYVQQQGVDTLFIALPMDGQPEVLLLLDELKDTTASVYFVPNIAMLEAIQPRIDMVNGIPVIAVCETPFDGVGAVAKRASDLVLGTLFLVLAAPLMLAVAAAIRITSSGPVLFRQRRYGIDGREFVVFKFRSMSVSEDGVLIRQACPDDARLTALGGWLRRTSIDELPQLFNVIRGEMSLVGPRPHAVAHNETYRREIKGYMLRHKVKPGITGWAQIHGLRGPTETIDKMRRRIEYDLEYMRRWSLAFDLQILLRTLAIVLSRHNAH